MKREFIYHGNKTIKSFVVPMDVTELGNSAFQECLNLENVILPDTLLTSIGSNAFQECLSLKSIHIPDSATYIHYSAFLGCKNIHTICWHGKSYSVECIEGFCMEIHKKKQWNGYEIIKHSYFPGSDIFWIAQKEGCTGHGNTLKETLHDANFQFWGKNECQNCIARVRQQGYLTAMDYRIITGACERGINKFLKENHLTWKEMKTIPEVLELTKGRYGHETFVEAMKD